MAVAPVLPWRKASGELLRHRLYWPAWCGTAALVVGVVAGQRGLAPLIAYGLAGFAAGSAARQLVLATRRQGWRGLVGRANGGMIVHIGIVMIAVAFAASSSNVQQAELTLHPGPVRRVQRPHHHLPAVAHHRLGGQEPDQRHRVGGRLGSLRARHRGLPPVRRDQRSGGHPVDLHQPPRRRGPQPAGGAGHQLQHRDHPGDQPTAGHVAVGGRGRDRAGHRAGRLPGQAAPSHRTGVRARPGSPARAGRSGARGRAPRPPDPSRSAPANEPRIEPA